MKRAGEGRRDPGGGSRPARSTIAASMSRSAPSGRADTPSEAASTPRPGRYGVEIHAGDRYPLGAYTLTERQIIDFARQWDPQRFHMEKDFAEAGGYRGLIASGLQTIGVYQRLAVRAMYAHWQIIAGRGLREARFLRPVRPGDTLTGSARIEAVAVDARGRTLVTLSAELVNQHGKPVFDTLADVYVHTGPAAPARPRTEATTER